MDLSRQTELDVRIRYLKKGAEIVTAVYTEQRLESREDIGFAPIGLDEPYRIVVGNNPVNFVDPLGLYSSNEFLNDFGNFSAGLGDALLIGTGQYLRDQLGIAGVDRCSKAYKAGGWSSFAFGAARLSYAGLAKAGSIMASSGLEAAAFRQGLKKVFRLGIGANWRQPNLARYATDDALRAAAGRTNPYINSYGAGVSAAGAAGGSGCGCDR